MTLRRVNCSARKEGSERPRALLGLALIGVLGLAGIAFAQGVARVDTAHAMKQIVKQVEPIVPPAAAAAKIGGLVVADIIVRINGTVESVTILTGARELHQAAADAIKQWTFKPFLQQGRPARVMTIVEVSFPDPIREDKIRLQREFFGAENSCRRQSESAPRSADMACAEYASLADKAFPSSDMAANAHEAYAQSLVVQDRFSEALAQYEQALGIRLKLADPSPATLAGNYFAVAVMQGRLGDDQRAGASFASAIRSFDDAVAASARFLSEQGAEFAIVFERYAAFKRRVGEPEVADRLAARGASLRVTPAPPPLSPTAAVPIRTIAGLVCIGEGCASFTEAEVRTALVELPVDAKPWFLKDTSFPSGLIIEVYLEAESGNGGVMFGRVVAIGRPPATAVAGPRPWKVVPGVVKFWVQPALSGRDRRQILSADDENLPIDVMTSPASELGQADLVAIIGVIRAAGSGTKAAGLRSPRVFTDVQPWRITNITTMEAPTRMSGGEVVVHLSDPSDHGFQSVTLRRDGTTWAIVQMSGSIRRF